MAKVNEFSVVFHESVLLSIIPKFRKAYPNEAGCFLFGEHWSWRWSIPYVTAARAPKESVSDTWSWNFTYEDFMRETKLAAGRHQMLLGWGHTHPWPKLYSGVTMQSHTDARTQIRYGFALSLIVGVWPDGWWMTCWRNGLNCPLRTLVWDDEENLRTLRQWYYAQEKKRPWRERLDR